MKLLPRTARSFLSASSMHGVRYLTESRTPLARLLWFVSICACVSGASFIIYANVSNWSSSPAVVTNMYPTLAKGKPFFPMVTVCPRFINPANLHFELAKLYQDQVSQQDLLGQFKSLIKDDLAWIETDKKSLPFATRMNEVKEVFDPCYEPGMEDAEECKLLKLLASVGQEIFPYVWEPMMREYILNITLDRVQPTLEHIKQYVENDQGVTLNMDQDLPVYSHWFSWEYEDMVKLYAYFFQVFDGYELYPLQKLENYKLAEVPTWDDLNSEDYPSLVAYMNDGLLLQAKNVLTNRVDLVKLASESLFDWTQRYLGTNNYEETSHILNSFSYDPMNRPFFGIQVTPVYQPEYNFSCQAYQDLKDIKSMCKKAFEVGQDRDCIEYCETVVFNKTIQDKAVELYNLALDHIGPLLPDRPSSLLPVCRFPSRLHRDDNAPVSENCWRRTLTDRGICFSSNIDGGLSEIVDTGESLSFEFAVDVSGNFEIDGLNTFNELLQRKYDILVTPPNHFAAGELSEEAETVHDFDAEAARDWVYLLKVQLDYVSEGTEDFKALDPLKRECYYQDENPLPVLGVYSEPNCVLECAWQIGVENCACAPWFLKSHYKDVDLCEAHGNKCFKEIVDDRYEPRWSGHPCIASCLPDCETVQFRIADPAEESRRSDSGSRTEVNELYYDYVMKNKTGNASPQIASIMDPFSRSEVILDNVGLVKVFVSKKSTLRIIQTATVTVIDMISNIGGTLGLFCGVSILSGAEILYWGFKLVTKKNV